MALGSPSALTPVRIQAVDPGKNCSVMVCARVCIFARGTKGSACVIFLDHASLSIKVKYGSVCVCVCVRPHDTQLINTHCYVTI